MRTRVFDLDGGIVQQTQVMARSGGEALPLRAWGPAIRLGCRHGSFARFEQFVTDCLDSSHDTTPCVNFLGSGDFHHVSLALLRRLREPCNLLVIDNHPDWMRGVPFLHCGTWLYHAAQLPNVRRIFHVGGDVDFDNAYACLAPWSLLRTGKIVVAPARRSFRGSDWNRVPHQPLRVGLDRQIDSERFGNWLADYNSDLSSHPLYVSLDKDVMTAAEAAVNWDSGHLTWSEVLTILRGFTKAADNKVAGVDVVGDWSAVRTNSWRRLLHWMEHPRLKLDANAAMQQNETLNVLLVGFLDAIQTPRTSHARSVTAQV